MYLREGDVVVGPCFGTRYTVEARTTSGVRIVPETGLVAVNGFGTRGEQWSEDGLARCGYRKVDA
jgi:hypothetical protein